MQLGHRGKNHNILYVIDTSCKLRILSYTSKVNAQQLLYSTKFSKTGEIHMHTNTHTHTPMVNRSMLI